MNGGPESSPVVSEAAPWQASAEPPSPDAVAESPTADAQDEQAPAELTDVDRVIQAAQAKLDEGQWYEALFALSLEYGRPELTVDERRKLLDLLDPLAGKVIYSTEHLIEPAYDVRRGEKLAEIAERYNVPWQLLANINEVQDPEVLVPGTKLKVVPGPFRAEVDLQRNELTLFAGRLYAGRFPITEGDDPPPQPGDYRVTDKQPGRTYYAGDGRTIPPQDPTNPYGQVWLDLGGNVCIHGSPQVEGSATGCISLSPIDANDVFGILSQGSGVVIRR
jgi:lipoprotein-anchoring transpeptidase ErfK/SrfK